MAATARNTAARSYARAVNVLRPSKAEMDRRNAPYRATVEEARKIAMETVADTSKTFMEHYQESCETRNNETDSDLVKAVRVCLLGLARRGKC